MYDLLCEYVGYFLIIFEQLTRENTVHYGVFRAVFLCCHLPLMSRGLESACVHSPHCNKPGNLTSGCCTQSLHQVVVHRKRNSYNNKSSELQLSVLVWAVTDVWWYSLKKPKHNAVQTTNDKELTRSQYVAEYVINKCAQRAWCIPQCCRNRFIPSSWTLPLLWATLNRPNLCFPPPQTSIPTPAHWDFRQPAAIWSLHCNHNTIWQISSLQRLSSQTIVASSSLMIISHLNWLLRAANSECCNLPFL